MKRPLKWIGEKLNSWQEICIDENARLRMHTVLFTFIVLWFYGIMVVWDIMVGDTQSIPVAVSLFLVELALFLLQFFDKRYNVTVACAFGFLALIMCGYFLYTGGMGGYGFLWIFIVPQIAVMVIRLRLSIAYNVILLAMIVVMLQTPLHGYLQVAYDPAFRVMFPLAVFMLSLCIYVAEYVRYRIWKQLKITAAELEGFAFTDPLTGAYNRHALTSHFGDLKGDAYGLAFAICDLDFFKRINDRHGHVVGDQMLRHVVNLIGGCMDPSALLYRWGGEEFLLIIKTTDRVVMERMLEDIRALVEQTPLQHDETFIPMTISIGGVLGPMGVAISECIERADEYLYEAKQGGRNRVVCPMSTAEHSA